MSPRPANYAFIDGNNLHLGIRNMGWELDYRRFRVWLRDKYDVGKAFFFIGYIPANKDLYTNLQEYGYELIFKPVVLDNEGEAKGNVDAELVLHTMIQFPAYAQALIVTSDGDFQCLVKYLDQQKKLMHIVIPNRKKYSALFRPFRRFFVFLSDLRHLLEYTKRYPKSPSDRLGRAGEHRENNVPPSPTQEGGEGGQEDEGDTRGVRKAEDVRHTKNGREWTGTGPIPFALPW